MAGSRSPEPVRHRAPGAGRSTAHYHDDRHAGEASSRHHSHNSRGLDEAQWRRDDRQRPYDSREHSRVAYDRSRSDRDRDWQDARPVPSRHRDSHGDASDRDSVAHSSHRTDREAGPSSSFYEDRRQRDWDRHYHRDRADESRHSGDSSNSIRRDHPRSDEWRSERTSGDDRSRQEGQPGSGPRRPKSPPLPLPPRSERSGDSRQARHREAAREEAASTSHEGQGLSIRGSSAQAGPIHIMGSSDRHADSRREGERQEGTRIHRRSSPVDSRCEPRDAGRSHSHGRVHSDRYHARSNDRHVLHRDVDDSSRARGRVNDHSTNSRRSRSRDESPPRKLLRRFAETQPDEPSQTVAVTKPEASLNGDADKQPTSTHSEPEEGEEGEVAEATVPAPPPSLTNGSAAKMQSDVVRSLDEPIDKPHGRTEDAPPSQPTPRSVPATSPAEPRQPESPPPPPPSPPVEEQIVPPPPLEEGEAEATPPSLTSAQRRRAVRERLVPLKDRVFVGCSNPTAYQKVDESKGGLLGMGTFGEVSRAKHIATGTEVALKKIKIQANESHNGMPITAIREIKLLKELNHPNICPVVDMVYEGIVGKATSAGGTVYMVLPYMEHDLNGLIERLDSEDKPFSPAQIKLYMKQLLEGTLYLHQNKILHRDIKAANILISNDGSLRIADFGLARPYHDPGDVQGRCPAWRTDDRTGQSGWTGGDVNYTSMVVTRWYRPPELLAGERKYGPPVDMWGLGCILAEMILRRPMFKGASEINQLELIADLCGSPNDDVYPGWSSLPGVKNLDNSGQTRAGKNERGIFDFGRKPRRVKERFMGMVRTELADLIDKLLVLDPRQRLTAEGALSHKWFDVEPLPADPASLPRYPDSKEANKGSRVPKGPVGPDGLVAPNAAGAIGPGGMAPVMQPMVPLYGNGNGMGPRGNPHAVRPYHAHPQAMAPMVGGGVGPLGPGPGHGPGGRPPLPGSGSNYGTPMSGYPIGGGPGPMPVPGPPSSRGPAPYHHGHQNHRHRNGNSIGGSNGNGVPGAVHNPYSTASYDGSRR